MSCGCDLRVFVIDVKDRVPRLRPPPPTKFTISIASPSATIVESKAARFTTVRLCSTATRRASMSSRVSSR